MGTVSTVSTSSRITAPGAADAFLRCPGERAALAFCVVANFVILAISVTAILQGTEWRYAHPFVASHIGVIRAGLFAALAAVPVAVVGRQVAMQAARGGGVRVGKEQLPELHEALVRACHTLGIERVPVLYVSRDCEWPAVAHSASGRRPVVVLNARLIDHGWREEVQCLTFVMAGALGSLRLGHTLWWVELLTAYTRFLPWLRIPLLVKWARSRDRCAAFVVPDGIRGLLLEAVGRGTLASMDVAPFLEQTEEVGGFWELVEVLRHRRPPITARARALYDTGFFDRAQDHDRWIDLRSATRS